VTIWLTILGMAAVTILTRVTPLVLLRGTLPPRVQAFLAGVPAAVFTALALKPLLLNGTPPVWAGWPPLAAGIAAGLAAWWRAPMVVTLVCGLAAFWLVRTLGI
jgi:branched-subunit amino acid transport protein